MRARFLTAEARAAALFSAAIFAGAAAAAPIETGVDGLSLRWDNTLRFNAGLRVEKAKPLIANDGNGDEGDAKFDRGDLVTSRLDLLSELDASYEIRGSRIGARVSGAGWYDPAYDDKVEFNPAVTKPDSAPPDGRLESSYFGDRYSDYTRKYYMHGAEVLDAFVFANTRIAGMPFNVKAGRHSLYWGESLFFSNQSVAYSQQPLDGLKASTSPGIETKEVFLPLAQISFTLQPMTNLVVAAQYLLEWEQNRFPEGGTYFASTDFLFDGPDRFALAPSGTSAGLNQLPVCAAQGQLQCRVPGTPAFSDSARRLDPATPDDDGDYGISLRWTPEWTAGGTFGAYFRRFDERMPWTGIDFPLADTAIALVPTPDGGATTVALPTTYRVIYPQDTKLYGLSFTTNIGAFSVAAEATYREDTALSNGLPSSVTGTSFGADGQGPRGNLVTGLLNTILLLPSTPLYDTGNLAVELAWSRLTSVTLHPELYNGVGYAGCNPVRRRGGPPGSRADGCSTRDFLGAQVNFEPQWLQVFPGVDLSAPLTYAVGLSGNKQDNGDGFQDAFRYSVGVSADFVQRYRATLAYADRWSRTGPAQSYRGNDRGWLALTLKATF